MVSPDTSGQLKIVADSTEITDGITATVVWPENAVALVKITSWNVDAANFIANLDTLDDLEVSFRYGSDSWSKYFDGVIEDVNPVLTENGQTVICLAYGQGRALRNTYCNTSYGVESKNPTIDTPGEIWTDLVTNYVNKSFGGANTGYALTLAKNNDTLPSINYLFNPYRPNIDILNQTLLLIQAYRAGSSGHHWIVGTDGQLRVKRIGTDISGWPSWWNTDRAGSTLTEGTHFIEYNFSKRTKTKDFANKIILATDLRKPGYDYWTNQQTPGNIWGSHQMTLTGDATTKIVGSYSLKFEPTTSDGSDCYLYYPSTQDAAWDLTKIGSEKNVPNLKFYFRMNETITPQFFFGLHTDATNYFYIDVTDEIGAAVNEFFHFSLPVGPYFNVLERKRQYEWQKVNNALWSNINYFMLLYGSVATSTDFWLDDLHFAGKIIREAYNSTNRTANKEHQKLVKMDTAVDDSMKQADDSGMAARLTYAELLRAQTIPIVGTAKLYGIVNIYPGQFVHIHAEQTATTGTCPVCGATGTWRIPKDFRVKQVTQEFYGLHEFYTTLSLTDDLINSFAKGPSEVISEYNRVMFIDPEAQSLRASGLDPLVPRLSKDYPS